MKHHFSAGRLNLNTIVLIGNDICGWCRCYLSVSIIKMITKHTILTDNADIIQSHIYVELEYLKIYSEKMDLPKKDNPTSCNQRNHHENAILDLYKLNRDKYIYIVSLNFLKMNLILLHVYCMHCIIKIIFIFDTVKQIIIPKFIYFTQSFLFFYLYNGSLKHFVYMAGSLLLYHFNRL